ncbi:hypothetical protein D3C76_1769950 [compost metagenome]
MPDVNQALQRIEFTAELIEGNDGCFLLFCRVCFKTFQERSEFLLHLIHVGAFVWIFREFHVIINILSLPDEVHYTIWKRKPKLKSYGF